MGDTVGRETKLTVEVGTRITSRPELGGFMRLTGEKGQRFVRFDAKAGRVRSVKESCSLSGEIEAAGIQAKVKQTHGINITVTVEKPKA